MGLVERFSRNEGSKGYSRAKSGVFIRSTHTTSLSSRAKSSPFASAVAERVVVVSSFDSPSDANPFGDALAMSKLPSCRMMMSLRPSTKRRRTASGN